MFSRGRKPETWRSPTFAVAGQATIPRLCSCFPQQRTAAKGMGYLPCPRRDEDMLSAKLDLAVASSHARPTTASASMSAREA
jgi:hypothetical protein